MPASKVRINTKDHCEIAPGRVAVVVFPGRGQKRSHGAYVEEMRLLTARVVVFEIRVFELNRKQR
jgi:hypothetical protein